MTEKCNNCGSATVGISGIIDHSIWVVLHIKTHELGCHELRVVNYFQHPTGIEIILYSGVVARGVNHDLGYSPQLVS